jgi:hypothetical protein
MGTLSLEFNVLNFAKEHRNRTAEHLGPLPTKEMMYERKKPQKELQKVEKSRHCLYASSKVATMRRRHGRVDNRPHGWKSYDV